MTDKTADPLGDLDNIVAAFQVEGRAVRGRVLRMGETMDLILSSHDYPPAVAHLLGEAIIIAALVGDALKFDGRLIVQANGNGPVKFVVAEYVAGEGVRAYAQMDRAAVLNALSAAGENIPAIAVLLGKGAFAMTIDYGAEKDQYQGVVPLEGQSLTECAENYFAQSEQTPTRMRIAVGESWDVDGARQWRGGGALLQAVAGDDTRGSSDEDWDHARALFETVEDAELLDPHLTAGGLLYRLFNEDGVRAMEPAHIPRRCSCERERLLRIIASFPADDQEHMLQDGKVVMTCEYCNKAWAFEEDEVRAAS